jgi:YbbR domain-containing protein
MSRWISQNISLFLLSLLLAFFFWAVATESEDPTEVSTFPTSIPVELRNLPDGMITYGLSDSRVRVEIRAPQSVIEALLTEDVKAFIDLTDVGTGTMELPIQATVRAQPSDITSLTPDTLELTVERLVEKQMPVDVRVQGTPAMGFRTDPYEVAPTALRIQGPESLVEQVVSVQAAVSIEDRQTSMLSDVQPEPLDRDGDVVPQIEIVPKTVTINVPISQLGFIRDIPVTAGPLLGQPASGYRVANLVFEPPVAKVFGRTDVVQSVSFLQTEPISLEGITQSLTTKAGLQMPEGLSVIEPPRPEVTVTLTVEIIRSGLTLELTPTLRGLADGYTATVRPELVVVILSGPFAIVESVEATGVELVLDVTGLEPGEYTIVPQVTVPDRVDIENVIPEAVPVRIEAIPEPEATPETG